MTTKSKTGLDDQIARLRALAAELHDGPDQPGGLPPAVWGAAIAEEIADLADEVRRWADDHDAEAA